MISLGSFLSLQDGCWWVAMSKKPSVYLPGLLMATKQRCPWTVNWRRLQKVRPARRQLPFVTCLREEASDTERLSYVWHGKGWFLDLSLFMQAVPLLHRFVNCMVYYALAMSTGNLGGDRHISFSLSGLVEIPSFVIGYLIIDKWLDDLMREHKCNDDVVLQDR